MENPNDYLTIKQAAERFGLHPKTVWLWTVDGKLPYYQAGTGGKILIKLQDLVKYLKNR